MVKNRKLAITLLIFLMGFILYLTLFNGKSNKVPLDLEETKEEVLTEIEQMQTYYDNTAEWAKKQSGNNENIDIGYLHPNANKSKGSQKKDKPTEKLAKYFIVSLYTQNVDLFLSCFQTENISQDLFRVDNPDKTLVVQELIHKITRNGKLKEVYFKESKGIFDMPKSELTFTLVYEDNKKADVFLKYKKISEMHHDENHESVLFISSVWDVIEKIEHQTTN